MVDRRIGKDCYTRNRTSEANTAREQGHGSPSLPCSTEIIRFVEPPWFDHTAQLSQGSTEDHSVLPGIVAGDIGPKAGGGTLTIRGSWEPC